MVFANIPSEIYLPSSASPTRNIVNRVVFANIQLFLERLAYWVTRTIMLSFLISPIKIGGLQLTQSERGTILTIITALILVLPIFLGQLCDRIGSKKAIIIALCLDLISVLLLLVNTMLPSGHLALAVVSALLIGTGSGLFYPAIYGILAQNLNPQRSGLRFGIPIFFTEIAGFLGSMVLISSENVNHVWLIGGITGSVLLIINILITCFLRDSQPQRASAPLPETSKSSTRFKLLPIPKLLCILLVLLGLFYLVFNLFDSQTHSLFITDVSKTAKNANLVLQGLALLLIVPVAWLFSKFKYKIGFLCSMVMICIGGTLAGFAGGNIAGAVGLFIMQCGAMLLNVKLLESLAKLAPENRKSTYMGFAKLPLLIAALPAYILTHFIITGDVPVFYWFICLIVGIMAIIITIIFLKKHDVEQDLS